jgi:hypothetical protein
MQDRDGNLRETLSYCLRSPCAPADRAQRVGIGGGASGEALAASCREPGIWSRRTEGGEVASAASPNTRKKPHWQCSRPPSNSERFDPLPLHQVAFCCLSSLIWVISMKFSSIIVEYSSSPRLIRLATAVMFLSSASSSRSEHWLPSTSLLTLPGPRPRRTSDTGRPTPARTVSSS